MRKEPHARSAIFVPRDRRRFIHDCTLILTAATATFGERVLSAEEAEPVLRIGLMTDLHHAEKPAAGSRHYRETLQKLEEAGRELQSHRPDFIVELGDIIDAADSVDVELRYLATINRPFSEICPDRHYVLGNHCVDTLTKAEFLDGIEREQSFYSFDRGEFHFIVLDACFRGDGEPYGRKNFVWTDPNIPAQELEWLRGDLAQTAKKTLVFAHQRLDVSDSHGIKNAPAVRELLKSSGKVLAVFQGHSHKNDVKEIGDIFYCTLAAMIEGSGPENNSYSLMRIFPSGEIHLDGFRQQADYRWHG